MEDEILIRKCQTGDKAAFQELITKYHPIVYKFLFKISGYDELSKDLTQDVFIKVIRNIDKFDIYGKAKFSTYIITISKNLYIDYLRKEKYTNYSIPIDEGYDLHDTKNNLENDVVNRILSQDIISRMDNLSEEQKTAIKLKYIEGLTLKEIGDLLKIEPKTVKSRIHNGTSRLRKMFKGSDYDETDK